ncbi:MAG: hypothetical protein J6Y94_05750 [Bacteriovoracaceae bacterium]|nr:hypothetical protein [Bacteriovoracaceae bacterium]
MNARLEYLIRFCRALHVFLPLIFLTTCNGGPRNMRAKSDSLTYDSRSPLELVDVGGRSTQAAQTPTATPDDPCSKVQEVQDNSIFNTLLKLCRPDNNQETELLLRFAQAPTQKVCLFPVFEASPQSGSYFPVALGTAKCFSFQDNTYQKISLPRDRVGNGKFNYQSPSYRITGVIMMLDTAAPYHFPCSSPATYTSLCVNQIKDYTFTVKHQVAFQAAQDFWEYQQYAFNTTAYYFLQMFYNSGHYKYYILL